MNPFFLLLGTTFALAGVNSYEQTALNRSLRYDAMYGKTRQVEAHLNKGAQIDSQAEYGETALFYSIQFGQIETALHLLSRGANPNIANHHGQTPLMKAADDCNDRVAARLLRSGANVNRADVYRKTPLMLAAESNCVRVVAVLLSQPKERVQIHARDQNFKEAFDYASHPWIQSMLAQYKQKTKRNNAPTVIIGTRRN